MVSLINTALLRVQFAFSDLRARMAEERGQGLLEWSLLGGFIALAIVAGFVLFDDAVTDLATGVAACIDFSDLTTCDPGP